jgi:hypothetical protein
VDETGDGNCFGFVKKHFSQFESQLALQRKECLSVFWSKLYDFSHRLQTHVKHLICFISTKACKWSKSIKPCLCKSSNLPGLQLKYQHRFSGRQLVGFVTHQNGKLGKVSVFPNVSKLCPICTASSLSGVLLMHEFAWLFLMILQYGAIDV